jgi:small nuclear ribonucleoprotein (snRNP)-like protein
VEALCLAELDLVDWVQLRLVLSAVEAYLFLVLQGVKEQDFLLQEVGMEERKETEVNTVIQGEE